MMSETKRLYRSRDNRMIGGVAGGLGEYFGIDPTLVRLIFIFFSFVPPTTGVLAYLVMMLVVPEAPLGEE